MVNTCFLSRLASPLRRLLARGEGERGVTAIEFALIAPAVLMMTFGTIEFGLLLYAQSVMESATSNTSRLGKTGYSDSGISRQQTLINMLAARSEPLLDRNLFTVTTKVYPSFNSVNQPEPFLDANSNGIHDAGETYTDVNGNAQWDADMGLDGLGNANDIVVYTVTYPWNVMTPVMREFIGTGGVINLTARTVVKNEPYDDN